MDHYSAKMKGHYYPGKPEPVKKPRLELELPNPGRATPDVLRMIRTLLVQNFGGQIPRFVHPEVERPTLFRYPPLSERAFSRAAGGELLTRV